MKKGFKKGVSGNPAGRPKGATNKVARPIKEAMSEFINEKMEELPAIWNKLSPKERANFIKELLPYFMARLQTVAVGLEFNQLSEEQLDYLIDKLLNK